ncbi:MAG: DUF4179 domain-containing protein [Eubacterium sp.]|nr:DUF4179 domain-containing protein [Eubacterium sp.]
MKINLYKVFDELNTADLKNISNKNIAVPIEERTADRIKAKVFERLNLNSNEKSTVKKKRKVISFRRLIAIAAVLVIVLGSITTGATVHFKPDSALAQYLTFDNTVDLSTLGQELDVHSTSNGYEFVLKQVLSDNSTMHLLIECPTENDLILYPEEIDIRVNGRPYFDGFGTAVWLKDNNICNLVIQGLRNIKNNDTVTIKVTSLRYFDFKNEDFIDDRDEIKGDWSFDFNTVRADVKQELESVETIKDSDNEYKIKKLTVSPLGIYIDYKQINGDSSYDKGVFKNSINEDFVIVEMKDGTLYTNSVDARDFNVTVGGTARYGQPYRGNIDVTFLKVINVDNIKSITIDGNVIYPA